MRVAELLTRLLSACYVHGVKLEPKFVSVLLAIGVVEGLGRSLHPEIDLLKEAAPFIVRAKIQGGL